MLETTSLKLIENLTKKHKLTDYQINQLSTLLKFWKKGSLIYPGMVKSRLNISITETYDILEYMLKEGFLERNFEIYCSSCKKFKGKVVRSLTDIPDDCCCEFCNHEIDPLKDTIAIYRMLKDE